MKTTFMFTGALLLSAVLPLKSVASDIDSLIFRHESLEEIEIISNRVQSRRLLAPQQFMVCSKELMGVANRQNVADMLMETGMVAVQKSQQGGGSPILRGFEASRILLVVDGVRMNNLIYRNGHLQNAITVDQFMLENMEVMNGPSSLNYGSDALGGTIVFNTRRPKYADEGMDISGNAVLRYGSANNEGTSHVDINFGTKRFASLTSFTYSHFGDLKSGRNYNPFMPEDDAYITRDWYVRTDNKDGDELVMNDKPWKQVGSGYEQYDIMQKLAYRPDSRQQHTVNFQLSNTNDFNRYDRLTEHSIKDGAVKPKYAEWYYGPQFRMLAAYNYETRDMFAADKTSLTVAYQKVRESRHNRKYGDEILNNRWENVDIVSLNSDWVKYMGAHKVDAGIDGTLSFLRSTANLENVKTGEQTSNTTRYPDGHNRMHSVEAFAMHTWDINDRLRMTDGVRAGYSSVYSSVKDYAAFPFFGAMDMHRRNATYSFAFGLNYLPVKTWKIAASAATAYRVPNIDTASKVFDSKAGTVTVPNAALKPEKTVSLDLNVTKHIGDRLTWENVFFATYYFDAITTARGTFNGSDKMVYDGVECDVYTNVNSRRAVLWGYSGSLTASPVRGLELNATFNYTYGRILEREGNKPLDHIPPVFGRVGVAYVTRDNRFRADFYALYNGRKHLSSYNPDGEDNLAYATVNGENGNGTPAWYTLNAKLNYNVNSLLTLQAGVENILDTEYRTFASGINAPGRNIYAAVRLGF